MKISWPPGINLKGIFIFYPEKFISSCLFTLRTLENVRRIFSWSYTSDNGDISRLYHYKKKGAWSKHNNGRLKDLGFEVGLFFVTSFLSSYVFLVCGDGVGLLTNNLSQSLGTSTVLNVSLLRIFVMLTTFLFAINKYYLCTTSMLELSV